MVKVALTHKTKDKETITNLGRTSPSHMQRRVTINQRRTLESGVKSTKSLWHNTNEYHSKQLLLVKLKASEYDYRLDKGKTYHQHEIQCYHNYQNCLARGTRGA